MGKAAKFKKFRREASGLILLNRKISTKEIIAGSDIPKHTKVDGKEIDPKKFYIKKGITEVPLNHFRNMKKAYNKHGNAGVEEYKASVKNFVENAK